MSKLREMIEAAKREKSNGVTSQQVLQPKAEQQTQAAEKKATGAEGDLSFSEKTAIAESAAGDRAIARIVTEINNPVVEQGPPAGLTTLQLIKWRKEHGNKTQIIPAKILPEKVSGEPAVQHTGNAGSSTATEERNIGDKSASQAADAQKTNSGTVDLSALKGHLIFLAENIEQKELVAQVVRTIAVQLQQTPELVPLMSNADVDLVVRGLRRSYSIAARKKSENKDARAKKTVDTSELHKAFAGAGLDDLSNALGQIKF